MEHGVNEAPTVEQLLAAVLAATPEQRRAALRTLRGDDRSGRSEGAEINPPLLMRVGKAAEYLGVSRQTLWRMACEGRIDKVEIRTGSYRIRKADLDRFASANDGGRP